MNGFFDKYPYTSFHEMNLDWLLNKMKEVENKVDGAVDGKQDILRSGYNIKTINHESVLGPGNIDIPSPDVNKAYVDSLFTALDDSKQNLLSSGITIKTINGMSILGSGDLEISGGESGVSKQYVDTRDEDIRNTLYNGYTLEENFERNKQIVNSTGAITGKTGWGVSDWIEVEPGWKLEMIHGLGYGAGSCNLYDESRVRISTKAQNSTSSSVFKLTVPDDIKYIRFTFNLDSQFFNDIILRKSDSTEVRTLFKPYNAEHINGIKDLDENLAIVNEALTIKDNYEYEIDPSVIDTGFANYNSVKVHGHVTGVSFEFTTKTTITDGMTFVRNMPSPTIITNGIGFNKSHNSVFSFNVLANGDIVKTGGSIVSGDVITLGITYLAT